MEKGDCLAMRKKSPEIIPEYPSENGLRAFPIKVLTMPQTMPYGTFLFVDTAYSGTDAGYYLLSWSSPN